MTILETCVDTIREDTISKEKNSVQREIHEWETSLVLESQGRACQKTRVYQCINISPCEWREDSFSPGSGSRDVCISFAEVSKNSLPFSSRDRTARLVYTLYRHQGHKHNNT